MPAANTDLLKKYKSLFSTTLTTGIGTGTGDTITPSTVTGLPTDTAITLTLDRVNSGGSSLGSQVERITGVVSGGNFTSYIRGQDDTTEQAHSGGAVIEMVWNAQDWNDMVDWGLTEHNQDGTHDTTKVATLSDTQTFSGTKTFSAAPKFTFGTEASGDTFYSAADGTITRLAKGTDGQVLTLASGVPSWAAASGGTAFWSDVPGTPTRVSDTQFTITDTSNTNKYDLLFKKGTIIKWDESGTFQIGMVISSSYGTDTVTINIVGDSLTAGFASMKYAIPKALTETFIIPGTLAAATDIAKTWYTPCGAYFLSADAYVKTAGTTNSTVFDINDDGSTKWTTKPTITTGTTSDIDNVADNPSTEVAAGSLITVDVDSVSTTAPVEAYVIVYWIPSDWRYRS